MENKKIYIGLGIAAAVGVAYFFWKNKQEEIKADKKEEPKAESSLPKDIVSPTVKLDNVSSPYGTKDGKLTQEQANMFAAQISMFGRGIVAPTKAEEEKNKQLIKRLSDSGYIVLDGKAVTKNAQRRMQK